MRGVFPRTHADEAEPKTQASIRRLPPQSAWNLLWLTLVLLPGSFVHVFLVRILGFRFYVAYHVEEGACFRWRRNLSRQKLGSRDVAAIQRKVRILITLNV